MTRYKRPRWPRPSRKHRVIRGIVFPRTKVKPGRYKPRRRPAQETPE